MGLVPRAACLLRCFFSSHVVLTCSGRSWNQASPSALCLGWPSVECLCLCGHFSNGGCPVVLTSSFNSHWGRVEVIASLARSVSGRVRATCRWTKQVFTTDRALAHPPSLKGCIDHSLGKEVNSARAELSAHIPRVTRTLLPRHHVSPLPLLSPFPGPRQLFPLMRLFRLPTRPTN